MPTLINRLAEMIATDNAILFVGGDLRQTADGLPAITQISEALASQIDYERTDRSLPAVARDYEIIKGRNALITALREASAKLGKKPGAVDQLIAEAVLPHTKILSTRFDRVLEAALDQFQKEYVLIIQDSDVPFFDESKITLIKMQGDLEQPDSLFVTEDDLETFINRLPTISDVVRAFFATKSLIFLGYDLNNPQFKRFFRQVTHNLSAFRRDSFAIIPTALDNIEDRYWQGQSVETIVNDPARFLESLSKAVKETADLAPPEEPTSKIISLANSTPPTRPYKLLDAFTLNDAPIFSGRKIESQRLANRILAHRLTVVYGESGSGKSSLMNAGVTPRLLKQRAITATVAPAPGQPLISLLQEALAETGKSAGLTPPENSSLLVTIREWQHQINGPIVLTIDQFEQFFLVYSKEERTSATSILNELVSDRSLNLRLVFILREDFVGRLQTLTEQIPTLLDVRFRLERLGREDARAAIEEPGRIFGLTWENALIEQLLDELYDGNGVSPPQLQIICDSLYEDAISQAGGFKPGQEMRVTQARFNELGGTTTILGEYLTRVVATFPDVEQNLVRQLLGTLVSTSGVKQRLELNELASTIGVSSEQAQTWLDKLTDQRLLVRFNFDGRIEYELTHDYLVDRITRWLDQDFWDVQKAREIIRQDLSQWESRKRLLANEDFRIIESQKEQLSLDEAALKMVYATAVVRYMQPEDWKDTLSPQARQEVLLTLFEHEDPVARGAAVNQLSLEENTPATAKRMAELARDETDKDARWWMGLGLGGLAITQPELIDPIVTNLQESETGTSTLTHMAEINPSLSKAIPKGLGKSLEKAVFAKRRSDNRSQIIGNVTRGLQGGFWGVGLGMGLVTGLFQQWAFLSLFDFRLVIGQVFLGIAQPGFVGALVGLGTSYVHTLSNLMSDRISARRRWIYTALTGGVLMGLGFVFLSFTSAGTPNIARALAAGAIIGFSIIGAAIAPLEKRSTHFSISILAGILAFILPALIGLYFSTSILHYLIFMGTGSALGFFLAFNKNPKEGES
jgi:hypothetical protein